jgi:hypothetical protein
MTFSACRNRASIRFAEVFSYLAYIKTIEPKNIYDPQTIECQISKGLAYVHLYGSYERSINDIVQTALLKIESLAVRKQDIVPSFHNVASYRKMQSYRDCGSRSTIEKSIAVFDGMSVADLCEIDDSMFQYKLQNVWTDDVLSVLSCFGLSNFQINVTEKSLLDSVVENRNKVAHGRESAAVVGQRQRIEHLFKLHEICAGICEDITDLLEIYIMKRSFVKPHYKKNYI